MLKAADLFADGLRHKEIAQEIGVHFDTVYRWMRNDVFVDAVLAASDRKLALSVPRARNLLDEQIDDEIGWLAQGAANSLLSERQAVKGDPSMQVVVSFSLDDTEPGMPEDDDENDV
jgi:hypothetical protein